MRYLRREEENAVAVKFDALLADFMASAQSLLSEEQLRALTLYDFPGNLRQRLPREKWDRYLRSTMRGEEWLIQFLMKEAPKTFVELGCGLGTWCFLAALSGAHPVIGIDSNRTRVEAARILADKIFPNHGDGDIQFLNKSLFNVEFDTPVDIFYLKAAIHHILPVDGLFHFMRKNLVPGGVVVIHDPNAANPISQYHVLRARGFHTVKAGKDPETGEEIPIADEDIFTLPGILWRCRRHGFRIVHKQAYLGLRGFANDWWYYRVIAPLNSSVLLGAFLAQTYQIVAQKPSETGLSSPCGPE